MKWNILVINVESMAYPSLQLRVDGAICDLCLKPIASPGVVNSIQLYVLEQSWQLLMSMFLHITNQ